jgi:hypothetical protein
MLSKLFNGASNAEPKAPEPAKREAQPPATPAPQQKPRVKLQPQVTAPEPKQEKSRPAPTNSSVVDKPRRKPTDQFKSYCPTCSKDTPMVVHGINRHKFSKSTYMVDGKCPGCRKCLKSFVNMDNLQVRK